MKKMFLFGFLFVILVVPSVMAININVEKTISNEVLVKDLNQPVTMNLNITNLGASDTFTVYNLVGFSMNPESFSIAGGQTKNIEISLIPLGGIPDSGFYKIPYFIRASDNSEIGEEFTFKIVRLKDVFYLNTSTLDPESTQVEVSIKNLENFQFDGISADFSSSFFTAHEDFSLSPKEIKSFVFPLNNQDFRNLVAGFYTMTANITVNGKAASVEGTIKFAEKNIITTTKKDFGFFINTQVTEKKNEGNLVESSETVVKKNIISRLFTSFSPEPDTVERQGTSVYYTWAKDVNPGETFTIKIKTNWLFPLLIILFVVAIVVLAKQYSRTDLSLRKKVTFVRAKGGEFALKVSVFVNAKRHIERVNVIDRLPALVKIYERFGGEKPGRIDEKNKRLEWNFEKLEPGELRVLSYIIYSKIGIMGKFALPTATAIYERDGQIHETESNQTFFMAEQRTKDMED